MSAANEQGEAESDGSRPLASVCACKLAAAQVQSWRLLVSGRRVEE